MCKDQRHVNISYHTGLYAKNKKRWWHHQMGTCSTSLSLCAGNSSVTGEFPSQRSVTRRFVVFFDLWLNKRLSKQSWAGDLRRHHTHYNITVMYYPVSRTSATLALMLQDKRSLASHEERFQIFAKYQPWVMMENRNVYFLEWIKDDKCLPTNIWTWWRYQMETFSTLLALCAGNSPVSGEFPAQRPVTQTFDVFFDLRLIKRLSKHSLGWWFETLSHPLWRHCNEMRGCMHYGYRCPGA